MLGDSSITVLATASSGGGDGGSGKPPPPPASGGEVGHDGSNYINNNNNSLEEGRDEGDRSFGGNRWPRPETLALLKIRSDMDVAFRDASVKGPLWEDVSRKLAELGYYRNAKKCKEKFENVYKYHKRTKDGRTGKQEGKAYRFFDQLEAFDHITHSSSISSPTQPSPQPPAQIAKPPVSVINTIPMPVANAPLPPPSTGASHITVPSTTIAATVMPQGIAAATATVLPSVSISIPSFPPSNPTILPQATVQLPTNPTSNIPSSFPNFSPDLISNSASSSTSSDVEIQGRRRKRKWKDFFERLMKEVVYKQDEMQRKFLEAIEKREQEAMAREESWRMQEMSRINREREILAQERSMAAAKDAAVMAFLQKLSEQQNPGQSVQNNNQPQPQPQPQPQTNPAPPPQPVQVVQQPKPTPAPPQVAVAPVPLPQPPVTTTNMEIVMKSDNGDQNFLPASSSRWPKVEVQALIRLRTNLDSKYQENGPKGPLWEEISAGMRKLGYNRNAKRCKEKWENINKYFKKVKESNKKRPEDSKTCPYFHQLDALYKEKHKSDHFRPENSVPLMVMPEQQWPPAPQDHRQDSAMDDMDSEENQNEDDKDDDDEDEAGEYEIVASKTAASMSTE